MGELILCKRPIAATPYFIDELSLNIYSLEELSYYISHNVYLLNVSFANVDLCRWIGKELDMKELETELLQLLQDNTPLHLFVGHILTACGYLTASEIKQIMEVIATFENKSEAECKKIRGDRLMEKQRIVDAIYEYENILDGDLEMTKSFEGNVYHNLGTAYCRLFFFREAANCFEKAYLANHNSGSLRSLLYAYLCSGDTDGFDHAVTRFSVLEGDVEIVRTTVDRIFHDTKVTDFSDTVNQMRVEYRDPIVYQQQLQKIVDEWKIDYNRLCKI
jgi:tetratricopeptide (TPR) repeat protein